MISVIVPVYNGEQFLPEFLKSILFQKVNFNSFEIILIDNNSNDKTKELINKFKKDNSNIDCKYLFYDGKASSYASRNVGLTNSKGDILAFTDVDCILEKDWLKNIQSKFNEKNNKIISGDIDLYFKDKKNIWENFDKIVHMRNDKRVKSNEIATANMALLKVTFNEIGIFDEVTSGGDFNFAKKAVKKGFEIEFSKDIKVLHPTRKTYLEIKKKLLRLSFGEGELYRKHNKSFARGIIINLLRILNLPKHYRISKKMVVNTGMFRMMIFNLVYFYLKLLQFGSFIRGYMVEN
ncbi:glycosyltransferase [Psychrilyobacter sp.]|uniref:glycosyltransferase n=1 Tax=Psychrilyobacter sp. TaxID=2586924 RepID=UPI00301808EF